MSNMWTELVPHLETFLMALVTGFIGWLTGRRKNNVEVESQEIDNEIKSAAFYRALLDDLTARSNAQSKRLDEAIKVIEERDRTIGERDKRIDMLLEELEKLAEELRKYKQPKEQTDG